MKQLQIIQTLATVFPKIKGLEIALLYGSFARKEGNVNSDIDIQIVVSQEFDIEGLKEEIRTIYEEELQSIMEIKLRNKLVCYFSSSPKLEIAIHTDIAEAKRYYLGSEIKDIEGTKLFERNAEQTNVSAYLTQQIQEKQLLGQGEKEKCIDELLHKFLYEFEACSQKHYRGDAYQFYFTYNLALHTVVQLAHFAKWGNKYLFLPKMFSSHTLTQEECSAFYDLSASFALTDGNKQKRKLLDFFYATVQTLISKNELNEVQSFCEWVYERDKLWNFRDLNQYNPAVKKGLIFRTASLSLTHNKPFLADLIQEKKITTIIDLRAQREVEEHPYSEEASSGFRYIHCPLDPWNQPEWFKESHHYGTHEEIAYRFFILACKDKIKMAIEAILDETKGAVAIHCFAGKDRTGIFISLLHWVIDTPIEIIYRDFLASENGVKQSCLEMVMEMIHQAGGIEAYFLSCGLSEDQLINLKNKLQHGN